MVACEPDIPVLDEPTSGLDYKSACRSCGQITVREASSPYGLPDMEVVLLDFATRIVVITW